MPGKLIDTLLTVLLPLITGILIYYFKIIAALPPSFITHHFADGLWAFSFINAILIVWNRQPAWGWLAFLFIIFIAFEVLQHLAVINGTGDLYDTITYFVFALLAIITNKYFKKQFHPVNHHDEIN